MNVISFMTKKLLRIADSTIRYYKHSNQCPSTCVTFLFPTAESVSRQTVDAQVMLEDLYPGAGYEIKVYAISHGMWSEPHVYFQAVCEY